MVRHSSRIALFARAAAAPQFVSGPLAIRRTNGRAMRYATEQVPGHLTPHAAIRNSSEDQDMSESEDKAKGAANKAVGAAKDKIGEATDDKDLQNEGKAQKLKGHGQDIKGEAKGALKDKG